MKFFIKNIVLFISLVSAFGLFAQQTPAPLQSEAILITGATAHLGNGKVIENAYITFDNGKLVLVADARTVRPDPSIKYKTIDASGKHVYPGFIAPNTQLGLVEIDAVRATRDSREVGSYNPNIRSIIAYNTDSKVTPTVRSNGVLLAQIVPQGGRISGSSSIVELDAWNWEDAVYRTDDGIHLNWPRLRQWTGWRTGNPRQENNKKYDEQVTGFTNFFTEAKAYTQKKKGLRTNLKFEATRGLFDGSKKLFIHTNRAKAITEAVLFGQKMGISIVLVGADDCWMLTDLLKAHQVPVILGKTQSLPARDDDDIDQPFKTAAALEAAGVLFSFSEESGWAQRNLAFQAGQAVAFGLEYETAIKAITLNTAQILGIDKTVGSLEAGKDATLFICDGDALDMRTSKVRRAFIQGKEIDLDNKQKALYRKFKAKYQK